MQGLGFVHIYIKASVANFIVFDGKIVLHGVIFSQLTRQDTLPVPDNQLGPLGISAVHRAIDLADVNTASRNTSFLEYISLENFAYV